MKTFLNKFSVFSILCITLLPSCNYTYTGKVVYKTNEKPLENATVILQNIECFPSIVIKSITDHNGKFELKIPKTIKNCLKDKIVVQLTDNKNRTITYTLNSTKGNIIKIAEK